MSSSTRGRIGPILLICPLVFFGRHSLLRLLFLPWMLCRSHEPETSGIVPSFGTQQRAGWPSQCGCLLSPSGQLSTNPIQPREFSFDDVANVVSAEPGVRDSC